MNPHGFVLYLGNNCLLCSLAHMKTWSFHISMASKEKNFLTGKWNFLTGKKQFFPCLKVFSFRRHTNLKTTSSLVKGKNWDIPAFLTQNSFTASHNLRRTRLRIRFARASSRSSKTVLVNKLVVLTLDT